MSKIYTPAEFFSLIRGSHPDTQCIGGYITSDYRKLIRINEAIDSQTLRRLIRSYQTKRGVPTLKEPVCPNPPPGLIAGRGISWKEFRARTQYDRRGSGVSTNSALYPYLKSDVSVKNCLPAGDIVACIGPLLTFSLHIAELSDCFLGEADGLFLYVPHTEAAAWEAGRLLLNWSRVSKLRTPPEVLVEQARSLALAKESRRQRRIQTTAILTAVKRLGLTEQLEKV